MFIYIMVPDLILFCGEGAFWIKPKFYVTTLSAKYTVMQCKHMGTKYTCKRDGLLENNLKGTKERRLFNDAIKATIIVEQNIFEVIGEKGLRWFWNVKATPGNGFHRESYNGNQREYGGMDDPKKDGWLYVCMYGWMDGWKKTEND